MIMMKPKGQRVLGDKRCENAENNDQNAVLIDLFEVCWCCETANPMRHPRGRRAAAARGRRRLCISSCSHRNQHCHNHNCHNRSCNRSCSRCNKPCTRRRNHTTCVRRLRRRRSTARNLCCNIEVSHVTRHTSHITRHTSHITRHTSHIPAKVIARTLRVSGH